MIAKMISDFHSHILPEIDDGSASLKESIAMLKMAAEQGVTHVVATPHFYPQQDSPERFLSRREAAARKLREEMQRYEGLPEVTVGAEVYFYRGISESDALSELKIGNHCCILIEMPTGEWSESMYRELAAIPEKHGITPIIAHVDRYISLWNDHGIPKKLAQLPVYVQANADSFLRFSTRRKMLELLKDDKIHLLGSDCHNLQDRAPNMAQALRLIEKHAGFLYLERIREHEERIFSK